MSTSVSFVRERQRERESERVCERERERLKKKARVRKRKREGKKEGINEINTVRELKKKSAAVTTRCGSTGRALTVPSGECAGRFSPGVDRCCRAIKPT